MAEMTALESYYILEQMTNNKHIIVDTPEGKDDITQRHLDNLKDFITKSNKALTPPTSEEVAKALSEEIDDNGIYYKNGRFYDSDNDLFLWEDNDGEIILYDTFLHKPRTYELIGRFYGNNK